MWASVQHDDDDPHVMMMIGHHINIIVMVMVMILVTMVIIMWCNPLWLTFTDQPWFHLVRWTLDTSHSTYIHITTVCSHLSLCSFSDTLYCNMVALADDSSQFKLIARYQKAVPVTFLQTGRAVQISHNACTTWVHHCLIFHSGFWRQVYSELSPWTHFELHLTWNTK